MGPGVNIDHALAVSTDPAKLLNTPPFSRDYARLAYRPSNFAGE